MIARRLSKSVSGDSSSSPKRSPNSSQELTLKTFLDDLQVTPNSDNKTSQQIFEETLGIIAGSNIYLLDMRASKQDNALITVTFLDLTPEQLSKLVQFFVLPIETNDETSVSILRISINQLYLTVVSTPYIKATEQLQASISRAESVPSAASAAEPVDIVEPPVLVEPSIPDSPPAGRGSFLGPRPSTPIPKSYGRLFDESANVLALANKPGSSPIATRTEPLTAPSSGTCRPGK